MEPGVQQLADAFARTLSPDREVITAAEQALKAGSAQPGYGIAVLKVIAAGDALGADVRLAAAVNFKNTVKYRWVPNDLTHDGGAQPISDAEKGQIKQLLTGLMLSTPPLIRAQLSEALSIISGHDFPGAWPQLLPELVERLQAAGDDLAVVGGVCATANSIFKRYRGQFSSNALVAELAATQDAFAPVALATLQRLVARLPSVGSDLDALRALLGCARLLCRVFYSLNGPGLTPLMESQLDDWMSAFHTLLAYSHDGLAAADAGGDPSREGALDGVKAAVCANAALFLEINDEEFAKFLQTFVTDAWHTLLAVSARPGQDNLAMSALRFLSTVSRSVHASLFAAPGVLRQVCESIVLPNLRVRDEDEELFEMNPIDYIRRDIEGGDADTRRRAAAELLRGLAGAHEGEVTLLCSGYVSALLQEHSADPARGWRSKDAAVYLVMTLTVRGRTGARGATTTAPLVDVAEFFNAQVLPELMSPGATHPILQADALKFVTTFRSQLPAATLLALLPRCTALLGAEAVVVHSYAATAVERFLALREGGAPKLSVQDVLPHAQPLLAGLFAAFRHPDSSENEYVMRAVMRLISFLGPQLGPLAPMCLKALASLLLEACKNPRCPGFSHYLFEAVAGLVRHCGNDPASGGLPAYEAVLFPAFDAVLSGDVQEFHPYVFQVLAQLIELSSPPLSQPYMAVFPPLLAPLFWERPGNVPALTRLLVAYLSKGGQQVVAGVLGVFQKLIASRANEAHGFALLSGIVSHLPLSSYESFLPTVWQLLFTRLQGSKTPRFTRGFVVFLSLAIVTLGVAPVAASMDAVQPGIAMMILGQVWAPSLGTTDGPDEDKLVAVAATKCLTEWPEVYSATALWAQLRGALEAKLKGGDEDGGGSGGPDADGGDDGIVEGLPGYAAAYAKLANAAPPERPVLAEIADPRQFAEERLARFISSVGGAPAAAAPMPAAG